MPDAADIPGSNADCPRCGAAFHCGAPDSSCECARIDLDTATRAALRNSYTGCLCMPCLRELGAGAALKKAPHRPAPS